MDTISISRENAIAAYNESDGKTRIVLGKLLGKDITNPDPCKLFKTWEDVCAAEGIIEGNYLPWKNPNNIAQVMANAASKLCLIFEAFNKRTGDYFDQRWVADYGNKDQYKYYPWFEWSPSLGAFVFSYAGGTGTFTNLGARLCTENDDYAAYIGKQFIEIWNEFLNPKI